MTTDSHRVSERPEPGEWVQIWAQVSTREQCLHPDDICVELFSHNAQFEVVIRRDRAVRVSPPEGIAARCMRSTADRRSVMSSCAATVTNTTAGSTLDDLLRRLPEDGATKSRDYGRGYAQAVRDVQALITSESLAAARHAQPSLSVTATNDASTASAIATDTSPLPERTP